MITNKQADILDHAVHRAGLGLYCGNPPEMPSLVAAGLMRSAGFKPFVEDEYFSVTPDGRAALGEWRTAQPVTKVRVIRTSRAFEAWQRFCDAYGKMPFPQFWKEIWPRKAR